MTIIFLYRIVFLSAGKRPALNTNLNTKVQNQKNKVDKDALAMKKSYESKREIAQRVQSIVDRNVMLHNGNRLVNINDVLNIIYDLQKYDMELHGCSVPFSGLPNG